MKLFWHDETNGDTTKRYVLKRQTPSLRPFLPRHSHDFAEIIYVEGGSCLHEMNDTSATVRKGDVLFIYPETVEHLYRDCTETLSILQILFPAETFVFMMDRYAEDLESIFGIEAANPLVSLIPQRQIWFENNFSRLVTSEQALINFERFLLDFFWLVRESNNGSSPSSTSWLERAMREIQEPENFRKGHQGFIGLCNLSAEHVERVVKSRTGRTVTDIVNQARMAWAAYMLTFSEKQIIDICYGCGIESLGHFYKLFRDHFGCSPAKYRKQIGPIPVIINR